MARMTWFAMGSLGFAALASVACGGSKETGPASSVSGAVYKTITPTGKTGTMKRLAGVPVFNVDHVNAVQNPFANTNAEIKIAQSDALMMSGWAIDTQSKAAAGGVEIIVDGTAFAADYGLKREEIAKYFRNPACEKSGFKLDLPISSMAAPGAHQLSLRVIMKDTSGYQESPPLSLVVTQ